MKSKRKLRQAGILRLQNRWLVLREIELEDVSERYLSWMNDSDLNRYLESRNKRHTLESLKAFVLQQCASDRSWMFAICDRQSGEHVGNVKLGLMPDDENCGHIGLIIGEKEWHGKGVGTEVIQMVSDFAFRFVGLKKLVAGMYSNNIASRRAFEKCGFEVEEVNQMPGSVGETLGSGLILALWKE